MKYWVGKEAGIEQYWKATDAEVSAKGNKFN